MRFRSLVTALALAAALAVAPGCGSDDTGVLPAPDTVGGPDIVAPDVQTPPADTSAGVDVKPRADEASTPDAAAPCVDEDGDGYYFGGCPTGTTLDCDDDDMTRSPAGREVCGNGKDEDCSGADEACTDTCEDRDRDGYPAIATACPRGTDCNDRDANIHPGAAEICGNSTDEDCKDGDLACPETCTDRDRDGYGEGPDCEGPDCRDNDPAVNPGATEVCGNGKDDDCTGGDETCPETCTDADNDGYGVGGACPVPDCNDADPDVHPEAEEVCGNGTDEDCSGADAPCGPTCTDADGDEWGNDAGCAQSPDCNDANPNVNPGVEEVCGNGLDDDCADGDEACPALCVDEDEDGYFAIDPGCPQGSDCDDTDWFTYPGAEEWCDNGYDEDCSGADLPCPVGECATDDDCGYGELCDAAAETCYAAKVWEWWAPVFYVDAEDDTVEVDLPAAVDFDGDFVGNNNHENANATRLPGAAVVYYSFVKTDTHWYLGYYLYFPWRWSTFGVLGNEYEHAMRAVLLVVEQDGTTHGDLVMMVTTREDGYLQYVAPGQDLSGTAGSDGTIRFDTTGHRPIVYVDRETHDIYGDSDFFAGVGTWDEDGFPGDSGAVYEFGKLAETPVGATDWVSYDVRAVNDELWARRGEIGSSRLFTEFGTLASDEGNDSYAAAPWRMRDLSDTRAPAGEILYDPADMVRRMLNTGWEGFFSFVYVYNPYAVRVDVDSYTIWEDADPIGAGDTDPFLNLYLRDGAGTEILVLSSHNGLQGSWYKDGVPVGTTLNMHDELGRFFFYGLPHPDFDLYAVEALDYDGGVTASDWLMDPDERYFYSHAGTQSWDWTLSEATFTVHDPNAE